MSDNTTQDFKNQITRAKILSEDLVQQLEQYSIVDCWGTYANAGATMTTMVCARQIYDILEDIYDTEVIDGFREPDEVFDISQVTTLERDQSLRDMLKKKPGKGNE
jgi:hypothetical protein